MDYVICYLKTKFMAFALGHKSQNIVQTQAHYILLMLIFIFSKKLLTKTMTIVRTTMKNIDQ